MLGHEKIKPCPFDPDCNVEDLHVVTGNEDNRLDTFYGYVLCDNCGCHGPVVWADAANIHALALSVWNERSHEQQVISKSRH